MKDYFEICMWFCVAVIYSFLLLCIIPWSAIIYVSIPSLYSVFKHYLFLISITFERVLDSNNCLLESFPPICSSFISTQSNKNYLPPTAVFSNKKAKFCD